MAGYVSLRFVLNDAQKIQNYKKTLTHKKTLEEENWGIKNKRIYTFSIKNRSKHFFSDLV